MQTQENNNKNVVESFVSQLNDLGYQYTIRKARQIICLVLFLQFLLTICDILTQVFIKTFFNRMILIAPLTLVTSLLIQDFLNIIVSCRQLDAIHFFKVKKSKLYIIISFIISMAQIGAHISFYFLYKNENQTESLSIQIIIYGGIGLSGVLLLIVLIKMNFVRKNMSQEKQQINMIKNSLISEQHYNYALKKSLHST